MATKTIRQTVTFNSPPSDIYELLMDSKKHTAFTGDKAVVSSKVGGSFTCYGNYIRGKNIELIPGELIMQEWRASDWPEGVTSTVTFRFAKTPAGTNLTFTQEGVPAEAIASIQQGWTDFYWDPMKRWLHNRP